MKPGGPRQLVGLIGYPIRHSISPRFQQAGFDFLRLPVTYEAWETPPDRVADAIARVRQYDCLGCNVTVPHKQAVMPLIDAVDERAARIGAVNTLVNREGKLTGYNTDADGLVRPLLEQGVVMQGARAALIGAGGVARAAAFALAWQGVASLRILARRTAQAEALAADVEPELPGGIAVASIEADLRETELVVNCTSVGMLHGSAEGQSPVHSTQLAPSCLVYDLVYNPATTPLLAMARELGARTMGGLPMLVYQGASAFELWTGQKPPVGLMMARAEEALRGA